MLLGSCKFSGWILRQFDWCFVLLLFTLQITKSNIKYLLQIIFSKGSNLKLENTNLNAILDSENFKIQKFEKSGREIAQFMALHMDCGPSPS